MIKAYCVSVPSGMLAQLKKTVAANEKAGRRTVIFCEDRLSLAAERAVCAAVGGTFNAAVYTFSRFLAAQKIPHGKILSGQGSAMVIRRLTDVNRDKLACFKRLSSAQAAQTVYDTIALLYSSRVSAVDVAAVPTENRLLKRKLNDLSLLYSAYFDYLAGNGLQDRNAYLKSLPAAIESSGEIRGADVVLLGFQSFTCSVSECASACMSVADNVYGIFTGGAEDIYVNESLAGFTACAEKFGGAVTVTERCAIAPEAEKLRVSLFNPECFHGGAPVRSSAVHVFEAADGDEELEFIAASIKKHVADGERYRDISVMLPSPAVCGAALKRVFSQYAIPYYVDGGVPLGGHFSCAFLCSYLACAADGCLPESASAVVSSPLFPAERRQKDIFRNYILRAADFRGGVKREPSRELCEKLGFDFDAVTAVRALFLSGLKLLPVRDTGAKFAEGINALFALFDTERRLSEISGRTESELPAEAAFTARAYAEITAIVGEAAELTAGDVLTASEFNKILKSGFVADKVSVIPPKHDAVFVGDVSATVNTGSSVVFAARLTGDVPAAGADTALLTDRELGSLERLNLIISPKISLVNMRARENAALNLCAFSKELYLSYPARDGGGECAPSEIISYAKAVFLTSAGKPLAALTQRRLNRSRRAVAAFCCEKIPALRQLVKGGSDASASVYAVLGERGLRRLADRVLAIDEKKKSISSGSKLFLNGNTLSPTALESYFSCPYLGFMRQGLRLAEREEGSVRPLDSGNFIHTVLQNTADALETAASEPEMAERAAAEAKKLLSVPPYSRLAAEKSGAYAATRLIDEAVAVCTGNWRQIHDSLFRPYAAETTCEVPLNNGIRLFGRIDRVDVNGDMVRVIDYKTGAVESKPDKYYMGLKLQLQLYLLSAARGRRAVAAYYFPAQVEFKDGNDGDFRLKGFMDGGDDVVSASDITLKPKEKSRYFDAYYKGRSLDTAMDREDFADFLLYGALVARKGADEMTSGYIAPSPVEGTCRYCKMGGCCGFSPVADGTERKDRAVKCSDVVRIVREERGD